LLIRIGLLLLLQPEQTPANELDWLVGCWKTPRKMGPRKMGPRKMGPDTFSDQMSAKPDHTGNFHGQT
jgi:hypothetical protein